MAKFLTIIFLFILTTAGLLGALYWTNVSNITAKQGALHIESTDIKEMIRFYTIKDDFMIDLGKGDDRYLALRGVNIRFEADMAKASTVKKDGYEDYTIPVSVQEDMSNEIVVKSGNVHDKMIKDALGLFANKYLMQKAKSEGGFKRALESGETLIANFIQQAKRAKGVNAGKIVVHLKMPSDTAQPIIQKARAYSVDLPAGSIDPKWEFSPVSEDTLSRYAMVIKHPSYGEIVIETLEDNDHAQAYCELGSTSIFDPQNPDRRIYFKQLSPNVSAYEACVSDNGLVHEAIFTYKGKKALKKGLPDLLMMIHGLSYDRSRLRSQTATSLVYSADGNSTVAWIDANKAERIAYMKEWLRNEVRALHLQGQFYADFPNVLAFNHTPHTMEQIAANRVNQTLSQLQTSSDLGLVSFGGYTPSRTETHWLSDPDIEPASFLGKTKLAFHFNDGITMKGYYIKREWLGIGKEKYAGDEGMVGLVRVDTDLASQDLLVNIPQGNPVRKILDRIQTRFVAGESMGWIGYLLEGVQQ